MLTLNGVPTEVYQDAIFKGDVEIQADLNAQDAIFNGDVEMQADLNATNINIVCWENDPVCWENDIVTVK